MLLYMREQCAKLARGNDLAKAIDYIIKRSLYTSACGEPFNYPQIPAY
jgi:hypothetical protein